ncbi:MBL fold metallo-hydrolase [Halegenticoccus soli]|uniref:MBL fold metallo-hydrolase n=1 Tax=Halegenticoccus soli TaxID=1985678 RepID=UPI001E2DFEFA|nr:MBL fold metallo-hydrolase [Halegenticoccus soli]
MRRITVSDGSPEGTNSAYALPERGVVIDPGPPGDASWERLVDGLADAGLPISAVSAVFVTHWHVDHAGLATRLSDRADAALYLHRGDAPLVADYARERARRVERDARRLTEWGVPEEAVRTVRAGDEPSPLPAQFPVRPLTDGDRVAGVECLHAPGHTLGHAAFAADGALYVGDAVLPAYTPNVGGSDTRVENPLDTYLRTLDRLRSRPETARPGHGSEVALAARIDEIRSHHAERRRRIYAIVEERGPSTPWDVATRCFGELRGIHVKMGAGEAAAHLSHLEATGHVDRASDDPVAFAPTDRGDPDDLTFRSA